MKQLTTCLIAFSLLSAIDLQAQTKQPFFVFAYAQKPINVACNSKVLITQKVVPLEPKEKAAFQKQLTKSLSTEYNTKTGFKNLTVNIVSSGNHVICYEGVKQVGSWNCTSTFYGMIDSKDSSKAMAEYNIHIKKDDKIKYTIIQQWSGMQN